MRRMQQRSALALLFLLGCVSGGVAAQLVVPPVRAGTSPTRWEYACVSASTYGGRVTATANKLGAEGWELVSAAPASQAKGWGDNYNTDAYMLCAKRALP